MKLQYYGIPYYCNFISSYLANAEFHYESSDNDLEVVWVEVEQILQLKIRLCQYWPVRHCILYILYI